jgi:hypothetical protein
MLPITHASEANVLAVKDSRELLLSQSSKIQEMILATADGIDTAFIKFHPRPSLSVTPRIRAATVEQLIIRATYERYPGMAKKNARENVAMLLLLLLLHVVVVVVVVLIVVVVVVVVVAVVVVVVVVVVFVVVAVVFVVVVVVVVVVVWK